ARRFRGHAPLLPLFPPGIAQHAVAVIAVTSRQGRGLSMPRRERESAGMKRGFGLLAALAASLLAAASPVRAEDGYALWLRYPEAPAEPAGVLVERSSPVIEAAAAELRRGLGGRVARVLLATTADPRVSALGLARPLGEEGYLVRRAQVDGRPAVVVASDGERGLLYGAFALLRHLDAGGSAEAIELR